MKYASVAASKTQSFGVIKTRNLICVAENQLNFFILPTCEGLDKRFYKRPHQFSTCCLTAGMAPIQALCRTAAWDVPLQRPARRQYDVTQKSLLRNHSIFLAFENIGLGCDGRLSLKQASERCGANDRAEVFHPFSFLPLRTGSYYRVNR